MADNRTGLSAADLAEQFRDVCGDGSMEWVYTPMQTWVLLDAADMLDEDAKLREEVRYLKKGDVLHVLTDQEFAEQQKHKREMQASIKALDDENAELRELVRTFYHCTTSGECDECPINGGGPVHLMPDTICDTIHGRMRELGVDA